MDNVTGLGLSGWRWMLLLEGLPAVIGGVVCYLYLPERPETARWLSADEKQWLLDELAKDRSVKPHIKPLGTLRAITEPRVLLLAAIYFVYQAGSLGVGYWMPQIIHELSGRLTAFEIGLVSMVPYAIATLAMILWSMHSDRTNERQLHSALPLILAACALACTVLTREPVLSIALISVALAGLYAFKSPFWALPGLFLTRSTAAVSIAAINSLGNLGGFVGPYALGLVKGWTGSPAAGLLFLAALLFAAFVLTYCMRLVQP